MMDESVDIELDRNQKMNLPQELLDFAKIENKVKIIGIIDHIEL
jgi:DNA-binding transcriptional regulator/RsmH inhibitor MraZ